MQEQGIGSKQERLQEPVFDVLIVGGGLAGLILAAALRQMSPAGFRLGLVERKALSEMAKSADPRAYALSAASVNMLKTLGLWSAPLEALAQPVREIEITDSPLEAALRPVFLHFDSALEDAGETRGAASEEHSGSYIVPADGLHQLVAGQIVGLEGITFMSGAEISALNLPQNEGHGLARVRLRQGRAAQETPETQEPQEQQEPQDEREIRARLVVAADGRGSKLRGEAGIKIIEWSYPQTAIIATVSHESDHGGRAVQHFLPNGPFALLPLVERRLSVVWTEERAQAERIMALEDAAFLSAFENRLGPELRVKLGALSLIGARGSFPLSFSLARGMIAPRFALVGDAAHGVHPLAGQGLNMGLKDVAALAEIIVTTARLGLDVGGGEALARYESWRRFDSASSALAMDGLNRLFSNNNPLSRAVRDLGLGVVDRMPELKRFFVTEAAGLTGEVPRLLRGELV